jgi:hypothetical protein
MKTIRIPRYIFSFGLIFFLLGSFQTLDWGGGKKELGEDAPIRFDGFYYKRGIMNPGQQQRDGYTYFRFYPDRTVVMLASASEPEKVAKHFGQGYNQGDAKFKLNDADLSFTIKHFGVSQSYEGAAGRDTLKLRVYGGQSAYDYDDSYLFYKVDNMPK